MGRQKAREGETLRIGALDIGGTKLEVGTITSHDRVPAHQGVPGRRSLRLCACTRFCFRATRSTHQQCNSSFKKAEFPPTGIASSVE